LTQKLLAFLCISRIMDKWQTLKDKKAIFKDKQFKIEQAFWTNKIDLYFIEKDGKLSRPYSARQVFLHWQEKTEEDYEKFAKELMQKNKILIEPLEYKKGDSDKIIKIRAALSDVEKRWLDQRLIPIEQQIFYRKHELWK